MKFLEMMLVSDASSSKWSNATYKWTTLTLEIFGKYHIHSVLPRPWFCDIIYLLYCVTRRRVIQSPNSRLAFFKRLYYAEHMCLLLVFVVFKWVFSDVKVRYLFDKEQKAQRFIYKLNFVSDIYNRKKCNKR